MANDSSISRREFLKTLGLVGMGAASVKGLPEILSTAGAHNNDPYLYTRDSRLSAYRKVLPTTFYKTIENRPGYIGTTRIVGDIQQFDMRDHGFAQTVLHVSNKDWEGEWGQAVKEAVDERNAIWKGQNEQQREDRIFGNAIVMASDMFHVNLEPGRWTSSGVAKDRLELAPEAMSAKIKQITKWYGAVMVGICELTDDMKGFFYKIGRTRGTLRGGAEGYTDPGREIPWPYPHKYAISIGVFEDLQGTKALTGPMNNISVATECMDDDIYPLWLESVIRGLGYEAKAHYIAGTEDFIQPAIAVKAGLGELGRLGQLVTPWGAHVRLSAVTTNMPLAVDQPIEFGLQEFCKNCMKCAKACPAGSISLSEEPEEVNGVLKYRVDPVKCTKQRITYGCAACAAVCPFSKPDNALHAIGRIMAQDKTGGRLLKKLDDLMYGEIPTPRGLNEWAPWRL